MDFGSLTLYRRGEQPQPFRLRLGSLSIGNDPSADISIEDPLLERFHARVVCTPAGCQLTDLGSTNGTLVNKERLRPHAPRLLRDGDRIQLGRVGLLYTAPKQAAPAPSPDAPARPADEPARGAPPAEPDGARAPARPDEAPRDAPTRGRADGAERDGQSDGAAAPGPEQPAPTTQAIVAPERPAPEPADDWNVLFQVPIAPAAAEGATVLPSNRRRRRGARDERELPYEAEDYLALLPPIYHDDRFTRQLLLIFKSVLDPLDRQIAQIHYYFDPRTAPEQLLPWLAAWVDLALDERWPEARRRELISAASTLYRWRGTRRGLSDYLRIYTGVTPRIVEQGQERPGEPAVAPHTFRVIIELPDPAAVDRALVERIIEQEKPAHTAFELELRPAAAG